MPSLLFIVGCAILVFVAPKLHPAHSRFRWWTGFITLSLIGILVGIWCSLAVEHSPNGKTKFQGFPFPVAILHLEDGQWVDYVHAPLNSFLIAATNCIFWAVLLTLPLSSLAKFKRKRAEEQRRRRISFWSLKIHELLAEEKIESLPDQIQWLVAHLEEYLERWLGFARLAGSMREMLKTDLLFVLIAAIEVISLKVNNSKAFSRFPLDEWERFKRAVQYLEEKPRKTNPNTLEEKFRAFKAAFTNLHV